MWLLVRMAFWLSVVIALLPMPSSQQETSASQVGAIDALSAASAAVSDIRQFCVRQPGACAAGSQELSFSSDTRQRPAQSGFISF